MKRHYSQILILILMIILMTACSGGRTLVETTWIVAEKNEMDGKYFVTTERVRKKDIKDLEISSKELWDSIDIGKSITFRYKDGKPFYLKAINNVPTYSEFDGKVKSKAQDNGSHFIIVDFQQIGEELIRVDESEWNKMSERQIVHYSIDSWGGVNKRLK